ncbi:MAG: biotin/lipoyl-containing protein, partial [Acidimicrobiales bacterium]
LDLVELQLRVASGEPLPIGQDEVTIRGHAIEARVVAEDPGADWLPSTGRIAAFEIGGGVRVDTGVRAGAEITPDYDSLLAKVIADAPTRTEAARRLGRGLRTSQIAGVRTNLHSLVAILGEADFLAARTPTSYLEHHPEVLRGTGPVGDDRLALLLGAVFEADQADRQADPVTGFAPSGWRNLRTQGQRRIWVLDDEPHHVEYTLTGDRATVLVGPWPEPTDDGTLAPDDRRTVAVRLLARAPGRQVIELDGVRRVIDVMLDGETASTRSRSGSLTWQRPPRFLDHDAESAAGGPICPLPGTVIAVHIAAGEAVSDGQLLMVVEAMKMEHKITAMGAATVTAVRYDVGDRVDSGDLLVALEAAE